MERKKYLLTILVWLLALVTYGNPGRSIYNAYARGDMVRWKKVVDSLHSRPWHSGRELLELVNFQYGYIAYLLGNDNKPEASRYLKMANQNLQQLERRNLNPSMLYAYKAAFIGFEIGLAWYKAPFIGPRSLEYAQKAVTLDGNNPFAYVQLGNIMYYTPEMFGGSKIKALGYYYKALALMEKSEQSINQNWNYLNLLATLINVYIDLNQPQKAREYCVKTLTVEPQFQWVRKNLCPELLSNL